MPEPGGIREVWEADGATWARLVFSSPNYPKLVSEGVEYIAAHDGDTSIFELPVTLDVDMEIVATTTAMSKPHDITYVIHIGVGAEAAAETEAEAYVPNSDKPPIEGLTWDRRGLRGGLL